MKLKFVLIFFHHHPLAKNGDPENQSIGGEDDVHDYKQDKILHIPEPDAIVDPNTMVIELFDANVTCGAMLRSGGLIKIARIAVALRGIHEIIELKSFRSLFGGVFIPNDARIGASGD